MGYNLIKCEYTTLMVIQVVKTMHLSWLRGSGFYPKIIR